MPMFRAIKVIPENSLQIKIELDLVVIDMLTEPTLRYLVEGFHDGPVEWRMYDDREFHETWRFILGGNGESRFESVILRADYPDKE